MKLLFSLILLSLSAFSKEEPLRLYLQDQLSDKKVLQRVINELKDSKLIVITTGTKATEERQANELAFQLNQVNPDFNCIFWNEPTELELIMTSDYEVYKDGFYKIQYDLNEEMSPIWPIKIKRFFESAVLSIPVKNQIVRKVNEAFTTKQCEKGILILDKKDIESFYQALQLKPLVIELNLTYRPDALPLPSTERVSNSKDLKKALSQNLIDIEDLSAFDNERIVEGRKGMIQDDSATMRAIQYLIDHKKIRPNSLILSDTGHDLPMAAQMIQHFNQSVLPIFYYPSELEKDEISLKRVMDQAKDWKHTFKSHQPIRPNIIFMGLEGHRRGYTNEYIYEIPPHHFPSKKILDEFGIKRVIYLYERHPDTPQDEVKKTILRDVQKYVEQLGLPVEYYGADCRRKEKC